MAEASYSQKLKVTVSCRLFFGKGNFFSRWRLWPSIKQSVRPLYLAISFKSKDFIEVDLDLYLGIEAQEFTF